MFFPETWQLHNGKLAELLFSVFFLSSLLQQMRTLALEGFRFLMETEEKITSIHGDRCVYIGVPKSFHVIILAFNVQGGHTGKTAPCNRFVFYDKYRRQNR